MTFIFKTTATMKAYNCKKWFIDHGIIREIQIEAENLRSALEQYRNECMENYFVSISQNAIKNKEPMYRDTPNGEMQTGYVITGKTDFYDDCGRCSAQYIDLWVKILTVVNTVFDC